MAKSDRRRLWITGPPVENARHGSGSDTRAGIARACTCTAEWALSAWATTSADEQRVRVRGAIRTSGPASATTVDSLDRP